MPAVSRRAALPLVLLVGTASAQNTSAQEASSLPVVTAIRLDPGDSIQLDGVPNEAVWHRARPATDFLQRDPDNGAPATERTEARLVYDSSRLILGVILRDTEPDRLLGNQMQRDQSFGADDRFIWTLDTFLDGRSGYFFEINPSGAMGDALVDPSQTNDNFGAAINKSWDGIWTARVRRDIGGWSAEIEIPFSTLNFDPQGEAWGVNFQRTVRRKNEESLWTGHARHLGLTRMSNAGRLEGLRGISQGLGLDLKPYVMGNMASAPGRGLPDATSTGDLGLDLFYNLTPALRANVSINTDFAETEVDQQQVNLTRFPLFFEEKRDFFLQGSSYFDFAREQGEQVMPFFSRRIGLDERGQPQRIDVGAKLTGKAGAFDVGALQVRTGEGSAQAAGADFSVLRVRRRVLAQSYVGGLYTRRANRQSDATVLHTAGLDFSLASSSFLTDKSVDWSGWYVATTNPIRDGDNAAFGTRLQFPNDPFSFDLSYRRLEPGYRPAVGFVERVGFSRFNPELAYTWRFRDHPWIRSIETEFDPEFIYDVNHDLLERTVNLRYFTLQLNDGSEFSLEARPTYQRLDEDFEISDGVILPINGTYNYTRFQIGAEMDEHYPVAVGGEITYGSFYSGARREYTVNLGVRPRPGLAVSVEAERNVLNLTEGSFDTNELRLVASIQFSPWISLVNNVQYDNVSRNLGWQTRFRWIQKPGNDLFLVYTHNWRNGIDVDRLDRWSTLDNRLATKLVYTLRF